MSAATAKRPIPRVALDRPEAAASLGMSINHFDRYVSKEVRVIRSGAKRLYPLKELERWAEENAGLTLEDPR